jgi:hypothetical protein
VAKSPTPVKRRFSLDTCVSPFAFMSCEGKYWDKKPKSRGCPFKNVFIGIKNIKLYSF